MQEKKPFSHLFLIFIFVLTPLLSGCSNVTPAETEELSNFQKQVSQIQASIDFIQKNIAATSQNSYTVYITNTGSKYHRIGCHYLNQSKIAIAQHRAQAQGYKACSRCFP